jgi:hypothetical protein
VNNGRKKHCFMIFDVYKKKIVRLLALGNGGVISRKGHSFRPTICCASIHHESETVGFTIYCTLFGIVRAGTEDVTQF